MKMRAVNSCRNVRDCLPSSSQPNIELQKADAQVSILLAAFPVHLRIVWQHQVFSVAGGEQQLWLAGHLDSSQLPDRKRQGSCSHPCATSVTEANWTGTAVHVSVMHIYAWNRFTYTVYQDFLDRLQYQHVQHVHDVHDQVTLTFPDQACTNC